MKALRFLLVSSSIVASPAVLLSNAVAGPTESPVVGGTTVPAGEWPDVVAVLAADGDVHRHADRAPTSCSPPATASRPIRSR